MQLVLYGKARCSLCDHAREVLEDVLDELDGQVAVTVAHVDITTDEALRLRYRHDVPVLAIDGRDAFRHRIDPVRLRARLADGTPAPLEKAAAP